MTFEEYLEDQERFGKIDTPEKLAFVKKSYESYLSHVEDSKYFEPFEFRESDHISDVYKQRLLAIFKFDSIRENEFFFMIKPSFQPEQLLVLTLENTRYKLKHTELVPQYWSVYYYNQYIKTSDSESCESELPTFIGDKLFALLNKTITEARKPIGKWLVLDGTAYTLSRLIDGKLVTVSKHSPDDASPSGKVIAVMTQLIQHISNLNDDILNDIKSKIDHLLS
jgi:hypothetical protein